MRVVDDPELTTTESVTALASALPRVVADPLDLDARSDALYGALGGGQPVKRLRALLGIARSLTDLGMREDGIETAVRRATTGESTYTNPRPVTAEGVRTVVRAAFGG